MQSEVTVKFNEAQQFRISANNAVDITDEAARNWLSQEYENFGCEPLNPVGKILAVDKVICVARAAGPALFADSQWAGTFAKAALASLNRHVVRIDVEEMTVGY
jgi:hypothetical protein